MAKRNRSDAGKEAETISAAEVGELPAEILFDKPALPNALQEIVPPSMEQELAVPAEVETPIALPPLPHEPSGQTCTLTHKPKGDDPGGPCQRCQHCRKKYRPHQMNQPCPARAG